MIRTLVAVLVVLGAVPLLAGGAVAQETVECSYPVSATDATGAEVTVSEEPQEIVVLGPSAAQTMWEIGAEETVTGMPVNIFTSYLEGSEERTNVVDDQGQPIPEEVVGLEPDLVLAPNIIQNDSVQTLRDAGLTVYRFDAARSLEDVYAKTELTGRLVGEFESAARTSAEMQGTVAAVRDAVADEERPSVYYDLGGGYTAGSGTFINELIETAGGQNIAVEAGIDGYQVISQEVIADQDPDYIVLNGQAPLPKNDAVNDSTAVQEDQIVRVNPNYLNQPGPRNVIPLKAFAQAFHPDAYAAADVENPETPEPTQCAGAVATATDTPDTPADTATDTPMTTATDTPGDSGPGFTAGALVVALVAMLLIGRRR